jgi:hypothetical protein
MRVLLAVSLGVLAAACASSPAPSSTTGSQPVAPPVLAEPTSVERAMATAEGLYSEGNPFAAVSRLTQELGNPLNTDEERVKLLMARAEMRAGNASDLLGALADLEAAEAIAPNPIRQSDIADLRQRIDGLNAALASGETPRSGRFEILFALGKHNAALDMLMEGGVTANPMILRGMYQIGYLCEGPGYTGAAFDIVDGDGTARTVRFCDSGK